MTFAAITLAKVEPDYKSTAIQNLMKIKDISLSSGAKRVRIASMQSGSSVGQLVMFQFFDSMANAENVYDAFNSDPTYSETMESGKFEITRRGLMKVHLEGGNFSSSEKLKYLSLTIGTADGPQIDAITEFSNVLTANGAITAAYGTSFIGDYADGKTHIFGATYASLNAMQNAYDAVLKDGAADKLYKVVTVQRRQLLRLID